VAGRVHHSLIHPTRYPLPATLVMSCNECVNRRAFLATSAAAAAAVALTACGDGQIGPFSSGTLNQTQIKVATFADLAVVGKLVAVDPQRVVKRTGASTFAAFSRECQHEGCPVDVVNSGAILHCFCHGSQYDNNGRVTQGPAARNLVTLPASYDVGTDTLTIG
jgi:Rieske Fe-S protein